MTSTIKVDRIEKSNSGTKVTFVSPMEFDRPIIKTSSANLSSNETIDSDTNALLIGPIGVDSGVSITINGSLTVI